MRDVRRTLISLLGVVALASIALAAAGQALGAGATIRIGSPQLSPGESATVTLEGAGFAEPGLGAITVDVRYDPAAVAVTGCKADPEGVFDLALCNQEFAADTVRVTAVHVQGKVGDFALAEITIEALGEAVDPMLDVTVATLADPAGAGFEALIEDSGVSESAELPALLSEESEAAGQTASPAELPATGGHRLLQTDQPWPYLAIATLSLGVAVVGLVLIRRRGRA